MVSTDKKTIDGVTYEVTQLTASEGRKMLVKLVKAIGPVISTLLDSDKDTITESIAAAIRELVTNISDEDLDFICSKFGEYTIVTVDGKQERLDLQYQDLFFAGAYSSMFKWLAFCVEVNYKDFFESAASVTGSPSAHMAKVAAAMNVLKSPK